LKTGITTETAGRASLRSIIRTVAQRRPPTGGKTSTQTRFETVSTPVLFPYTSLPMDEEMTRGSPVFSVVVATFNRADEILRAVGSLLTQTCDNFEIVIADDGSSDRTVETLRTINDPRVRVLELDHRGVCAARNAGIAVSTGTYISFLDSDDTVDPEWLAEFAARLHTPAPALVRCGSMITDPTGEELQAHLPLGGRAFYPYGTGHSGTYAVARSLLEQVGGFTEGLRFGENTELLIRVLVAAERQGAPVRIVARPLVRVRRRSNRVPEYGSAPGEAAEYVLHHHRDSIRSDRSLLSDYLAVAGTAHLREGRRGRAATAFVRAWLAKPTRRGALRLGLLAAPRSVLRARTNAEQGNQSIPRPD
jgi:hypothetical protein